MLPTVSAISRPLWQTSLSISAEGNLWSESSDTTCCGPSVTVAHRPLLKELCEPDEMRNHRDAFYIEPLVLNITSEGHIKMSPFSCAVLNDRNF